MIPVAQPGASCRQRRAELLESLRRSVTRFLADGDIEARVGQSLLAKLDEATAAVKRGDTAAAVNILTSFIKR